MPRPACTALLATALLGLSACAHSSSSLQEREEARLAEMLDGMVPGEPRSCISTPVSTNLMILHRTAVVYRERDTIWVSRPSRPESLDWNDILVVERSGPQLCKQDVVHTLDATTKSLSGIIFLGDFVPYRKP